MRQALNSIKARHLLMLEPITLQAEVPQTFWTTANPQESVVLKQCGDSSGDEAIGHTRLMNVRMYDICAMGLAIHSPIGSNPKSKLAILK